MGSFKGNGVDRVVLPEGSPEHQTHDRAWPLSRSHFRSNRAYLYPKQKMKLDLQRDADFHCVHLTREEMKTTSIRKDFQPKFWPSSHGAKIWSFWLTQVHAARPKFKFIRRDGREPAGTNFEVRSVLSGTTHQSNCVSNFWTGLGSRFLPASHAVHILEKFFFLPLIWIVWTMVSWTFRIH